MQTGPTRPRWVKRLRDLFVFVLVLLVSLKIADLLLGRLVGLQTAESQRSLRLKEHPPNLSITMRASKRQIATSQGLSSRSVRFRTDKDGFILGPSEAPGPVDFVFIGGSTTECAYVDESLRFPYLVSQLLRRRDGSPSRTINAGVSGNHSIHSTLIVLGKVLPYRPRAVVVMHNANDLGLLRITGSYWRAPADRSIVVTKSRTSLRSMAVAAKDFLIPNMWLMIRMRTKGALRGGRDDFAGLRGQSHDPEAMKADFHASLTSLVSILRAWQIEPVLMTQFNRMELNEKYIRPQWEQLNPGQSWPEYVTRYRQFNEIVRQVARENGTQLIDLDRRVPHSPSLLYDAFHLNDQGSKLVAGIVARELVSKFPEYRLAATDASAGAK